MTNPEQFPNSKEEEQKRKEESLRQYLEEEFEEKFSDFQEDLSEEKYQRKKEEWIQDKMEEAQEIEDSNQRTEEVISREREARIDSVTGLERREGLFKNMNEKVKDILGIEEGSSREEWIKRIQEQSPEDIKSQQEPTVMMADVSYLNLVNKFGHEKGDQLLKTAGRSFRNLNVKGFRHGGDELTALFDDKQEAPEKVEKIKNDFEGQQIKELSDKYGLSPKIDIATADYSEALQATKDILADEKIRNLSLKDKHPLKMFNDTWVEIADKRSFQRKAEDRIEVLMDKYENDPEAYKSMINYLYKGAYEISDDKVEELVKCRQEQGEAEAKKKIKKFIDQQEQNMMDHLIEKEEDAQKKNEEEDVSSVRLELARARAISSIV